MAKYINAAFISEIEEEYLRKSLPKGEVRYDPDNDLEVNVFNNSLWEITKKNYDEEVRKLNTARVSNYLGKMCPSCGSNNTYPLTAQYSASDEQAHVFIQCRNCGTRSRAG